MNRRALFLVLAALAITAPALPAYADQPAVHTGLLSNAGVGGYDPVAYFTTGAPTRGSSQFKTTHQGVEYRFANAENLARFRANPSAYLPQYGGYCAWAVSQGYTAPGDPRRWRIVNGRLYLNYNADVQRRWDAERGPLIARGDANWPSVLRR
ncbi:MAG: YHS domain-containing (seleno)protein [Caulobacterales bacterium]